MINSKKVVIVMPAYNAAKTLEQTYKEIPFEIVDDVILTDDASKDSTEKLARKLGITTIVHRENKGYGGNQKTCYKAALKMGADIIIMVHPDYQYTPKLITAMASIIAYDVYDVVLGSRIIGGRRALRGGMPLYKYIFNRLLTLIQNLLMGQKLSEYHTGYRAFSKKVIESIPLKKNSDDFIFDNQMLTQICYFGYSIGEVSCPTSYHKDASSINILRSSIYGLGCISNSIIFRAAKLNIYIPSFLKKDHK